MTNLFRDSSRKQFVQNIAFPCPLCFCCMCVRGNRLHYITYTCCCCCYHFSWGTDVLTLQYRDIDLWRWVSCYPVLFDLMMALRSRETHSISLKNMALLRPKLSDFFSTNQIARFVNYHCYGVNVMEFSIQLKNWKHSHGMEIRSRDSFIIPLMIEETGPSFSLFHYESLLSKVYRRDTRDSSS